LSTLVSLTCPTCGANLQVEGDTNLFQCSHCRNKYILDHKIHEMDEGTRKNLAPLVTYTKEMGQWLKVAEYDLILHQMETNKTGGTDILYIDVGYENKSATPVKYRHDQWVVFTSTGHSFEPAKEFTHPQLYESDKIYLGMTRVLNPGMNLRGWLAFVLPGGTKLKYIQFSGGISPKTVEFQLS